MKTPKRPPPEPEAEPGPARMTPRRLAGELERLALDAGRIQVRLTMLGQYLDHQGPSASANAAGELAEALAWLAGEVLVGQVPITAGREDSVAAGRYPLFERSGPEANGTPPVPATDYAPAPLPPPPAAKRKGGRKPRINPKQAQSIHDHFCPNGPQLPIPANQVVEEESLEIDPWRDTPVSALELSPPQRHVLQLMEIATMGGLADYLAGHGIRAFCYSPAGNVAELNFHDAGMVLASFCLWWQEGYPGPIPFTPCMDNQSDREKNERLVDWLRRKRTGDTEPSWDRWSEFPVLLEDGQVVAVVFEPRGEGFSSSMEFRGPMTSTGYYHHVVHPWEAEEKPLPPIVAYAETVARAQAAELAEETRKAQRKGKAKEKTTRKPKVAAAAPVVPTPTPAPDDETLGYQDELDHTGRWRRCTTCLGDFDHLGSSWPTAPCHRTRKEVLALRPCAAAGWRDTPLDVGPLYAIARAVRTTLGKEEGVYNAGQLQDLIREKPLGDVPGIDEVEGEVVLEALIEFLAEQGGAE